MSSLLSVRGREIPDYCNEQVFERNRLPPRAYHIPETSLLLNGIWQFHYALTPLEAPPACDVARKSRSQNVTPSDESSIGDLEEVLDLPEWKSMPVPSHWQLHGYGRPHYTNTVFPFPCNPPFPPSENPTGTYRRSFRVPQAWSSDSQLRLRFDGVDSAFHVWVNGEFVGYSQGSRNPSEFDVSDTLRRDEENVVQVRVYQWSDGSYIEDQDQWWLSGIFRDVHLLSFPRSRIEDFFVRTELDEAYSNATLHVKLDFTVHAESELSIVLKESENSINGAIIASQKTHIDTSTKQQHFEFDVKVPRKWTAETPYLYQLDLELTESNVDEVHKISQAVGFRKVELKNGLIAVNGAPILFRGVNRHDHHPLHGRAVPLDYMRKDLILMKQHNINALRMSHYPPHPKLLEMTNEIGLWVIDEADLECHGFYDAVAKPQDIPESMDYEERKKMTFGKAGTYTSDNEKWRPAYLDRMKQLIQRDKNQPSIIIWSLGNEAFYGRNHEAMYHYSKAEDPGRLIHYEADREAQSADMYSYMYPAVDKLIEIASTQGVKTDGTFTKPVILCEYNHAMGNHGNAEGYQEAFRKHPRLQGGFIWEWANHGLWKEEGTKGFYAVGGDFGDQPNDGNFIADGLCYSNHTAGPGLVELKRVIAPCRAWLEHGKLCIENGYDFDDMHNLVADFKIQAFGSSNTTMIKAGVLPLDVIAPRTFSRIALPENTTEGVYSKETYLTVTFRLKTATVWAEAGHEVAWTQIRLDNPKRITSTSSQPSSIPTTLSNLAFRSSQTSHKIYGAGFTFTFSRTTGALTSWFSQSRPLLLTPPTPTAHAATLSRAVSATGAITPGYWRAQTDNDIPHATPIWRNFGLNAMTSSLRSFRVKKCDDAEVVLVAVTAVAPPVLDWRFITTTTYRITATGQLFISTHISPEGYAPPNVPRIGLDLTADKRLDHATWFGPGPGQSYPDAKASQKLGIWQVPVEELMVNYEHPQENGNRMDTRWLQLTDERGVGVRATLVSGNIGGDEEEKNGEPKQQHWFNWNASRHSARTLDEAKHPCDLVKEDAVLLRLDIATAGMGTAACGPRTLKEYEVGVEERSWEICLEAVNA